METSSTTAFAMYLTFYLALTLLSILWIFSIVSRYCRVSYSNSSPGQTTTMVVVLSTNNQVLSRGLETSVIEGFPKFVFTNTDLDLDLADTGLRMTSECVVCLGVFEKNEMLRLLPKCGHVFHADCVDVWMRSHATCPFCRANLLENGRQEDVVIDVRQHL